MQVAFQTAARFIARCDDARARGNEFGAGGGVGDRGSDQVAEITDARLGVWWQRVGRRRADGRHPQTRLSTMIGTATVHRRPISRSRSAMEPAARCNSEL